MSLFMPGKTMGYAGAILCGNSGIAESKIKAFNDTGVPVSDTLDQMAQAVQEKLAG